jgi:hypothetical protein
MMLMILLMLMVMLDHRMRKMRDVATLPIKIN